MIVASDGSGDFLNLQQAVDAVPDNNAAPVVVHIKPGVYKQKVEIKKPYVSLVGEDAEKTILSYDDCANKTFPNGEKYGTFNSYTLYVSGSHFTAENLTIENAAGSGRIAGQALALYADSDKAIFRNCRLLGHQDTIFTGPLPPAPIIPGSFRGPAADKPRRDLRQYYEGCCISGDVDFVFGSATAVFKNCELHSNDRKSSVNGYVTAASTPEGRKFGYVFMDCRLTSDAAPGTVYLGRPWRDFARVAFIHCNMGAHIAPAGWADWGKKQAVRETVRYAEYGNYGPGASGERAEWAIKLTKEQASAYTLENIFENESDPWTPVALNAE